MLEAYGEESWRGKSPGGFEFGIQGWNWAPPVPRAITFFLDNTCVVSDQYGRCMKGCRLENGQLMRFADRAPEDRTRQGGGIAPRPQFATHAQTIEALLGERIDVIEEINRYGEPCRACKGNKVVGNKWCQTCFHRDSGESTGMAPAITYVGWPQLPYDTLKRLKRLPQTPESELKKILDPELRKVALRLRREADAEREKELQLAEKE